MTESVVADDAEPPEIRGALADAARNFRHL
jgi:hypothetical protein